MSVHNVFEKNNFKSLHGLTLCHNNQLDQFDDLVTTINKYNVVSDWCDEHISEQVLKGLFYKFSNALFVLNTRNLSDWIKSRLKHYHLIPYAPLDPKRVPKRWGEKCLDPVCFLTAMGCVNQRTDFYRSVYNIFKGSDNLIVLDVADPLFYSYISKEVDIDIVYDGTHYNTTKKTKRFDMRATKLMEATIRHVLDTITAYYNGKDMNTKLTLDDDLNKCLLTFKNNIK